MKQYHEESARRRDQIWCCASIGSGKSEWGEDRKFWLKINFYVCVVHKIPICKQHPCSDIQDSPLLLTGPKFRYTQHWKLFLLCVSFMYLSKIFVSKIIVLRKAARICLAILTVKIFGLVLFFSHRFCGLVWNFYWRVRRKVRTRFATLQLFDFIFYSIII